MVALSSSITLCCRAMRCAAIAKLLGIAVLDSRNCKPLFFALYASLIGLCAFNVWRVVLIPITATAELQTPSQVSFPVDHPRIISTMASTSANVKCLAKVAAQLTSHFGKQASIARFSRQGLVYLCADRPAQVAEVLAIA